MIKGFEVDERGEGRVAVVGKVVLLRFFRKLPRRPKNNIRLSCTAQVYANNHYVHISDSFLHCSNSAGILNSNDCFVSLGPSSFLSLSVPSVLGSLGSFLGRLVLISMVTCKAHVSINPSAAQEGDRKANIYRRVFTAVIDTHRPIVFELDVHHRLEHAVFDSLRNVRVSHFVVEMVVDLARSLSVGRIVEVGLVAFLHFAVEGEL